jgi:hypothetical protein
MLTFILARLGPAAEARFLGLVTTGETHAKPPVNGQRRRDAHKAPIVIPKARPRRPITVYECDSCGERALGEQRCETCSTFMRRIGIGGSCPACDAPVAIYELVDQEVTT